MKPQVNVSHVVQVVLATVVAVLGYLASQPDVLNKLPYGISAGVLLTVATVIGIVGRSLYPDFVTTTTTVTPTAPPGPPPPPVSGSGGGGGGMAKVASAQTIKITSISDRPPPRSDMRGMLVAGVSIWLLAAGCAMFRHAEGPIVQLRQCVAEHAIAGESVAQIALSCSADVPAVLEALLTSTDPRVQQAAAALEAHKAKAALKAVPE